MQILLVGGESGGSLAYLLSTIYAGLYASRRVFGVVL